MKFLFITNSITPFAPSDVLIYRAAERLIDAGHQVVISPFDWGEKRSPRYVELARRGVVMRERQRPTVHTRLLPRLVQRIVRRFRHPLRDYQFIEAERPDLVILNDPGTYSMFGHRAFSEWLLRAKTPFVTLSQYHDERGTLSEVFTQRARGVFSAARRIFFVSQRNREVCERQLCMALPHATVIDNPPDFDDWSAVPYPESSQARLALVARFDCGIKCQDLVIDALASEPWRNRDWKLSLYGAGPDEAYLRRLVSFRRLEDRIVFQGHTQSMRKAWAQEQLLILCSSGEGKPLALTEAMICGRGAVVTDVGGNAELVQDEVSGFIAIAPTVAAIHAALERAWLRRHEWAEVGNRARQAILERLSPAPDLRFANALIELATPAEQKP